MKSVANFLHRHKMLAAFVPALLLAVAAPGLARASMVEFVTPDGSTLDGLPVDAKVVFTTSQDELNITLENLIEDPTSVIQNLSDLRFTLSTGELYGTLTASSGLERKVLGDGTYIDGSVVDTGWELETNPLRLHVLGTSIGPKHTILGNPGDGDLYNNANGSIAGNKPHNPFLAGPISFTISIPGLTSDSAVTAATFSFGTAEGNDVPGVPEPATAALLMLGAGLTLRRR